MILLEFQNRIIMEALESRAQTAAAGGKMKDVDVTVADFDGVTYHVSNKPGDDTKTHILVSIRLDYFHQIEPHGVMDYMKGIYGDKLEAEPEDGYNITLLVDVTKLGSNPEPEIKKIASLKRNCFAAVFQRYFQLQASGGAGIGGEGAVIKYRPEETMFISAHKDRVTVIFSTKFSDDDDVVIGKLFLQEFSEARKNNQSAPQVIFKHKDPPEEIASLPDALTGDNVGYVTFVLFPRHTSEKCANNTIDLVHTFRNYLHYHLKCSKAYLHMRMRARVTSLLKVLNRAKPENDSKVRRTATGKSFVRK
eukprot:m.332986 g.332986  ORF g.332986 m.332986 type:complete len:307 (+) comp17040_c0_seq1:93-1013(+)